MTEYVKDADEPWYSYIKDGLKTIEGRVNKGDFAKMKEFDIILMYNKQRTEFVRLQITKINRYSCFREYLSTESLNDCLPGITTITDGIAAYRQYFSVDDELKYGVLAIHIKKV